MPKTLSISCAKHIIIQINTGGIGVSLNAATADVANWPALWKESFEKVDMQGSLSLKAPDSSGSPH